MERCGAGDLDNGKYTFYYFNMQEYMF